MNPQNAKSKSDYNIIQVHLRGDRKYVNYLKSRANNADKPLADYLREMIDNAIGCQDNSFFESCGKQDNQSGKA